MFAKPTLVFLALAAAVTGAPERIAGGSEATKGEIAFQVSLQDSSARHLCGGAIINDLHVLTAARCIPSPVGQLFVMSGSANLSDPGVTTRVQSVFMHENFTIEDGVPHRDVAVLKLAEKITYNEGTGRVFLPPQNYTIPVNTSCTVAGWGATSLGGSFPSVLRKVDVPVWNVTDCQKVYSGLHSLPADQICAGFEAGGSDACDLDYGGPLFRNGIMYGIFSWGGGCGQRGVPGVYTEVAPYKAWIDNNSKP